MTTSSEHQDSEHLQITIDADLQAAAQQVFQRLGLDLTTAITLFSKQSVVDQGLPFRPNTSTADSYTLEGARQIVQSEQLKTYADLDSLWRDLDGER